MATETGVATITLGALTGVDTGVEAGSTPNSPIASTVTLKAGAKTTRTYGLSRAALPQGLNGVGTSTFERLNSRGFRR